MTQQGDMDFILFLWIGGIIPTNLRNILKNIWVNPFILCCRRLRNVFICKGEKRMWIILGISAVITALLNLIFSFMGKSVRWLGFLSFSLTALTVCAIYQVAAGSVIQEDWSALADTVPTMEKFTWIFTVLSMVINGISLWKSGVKK